MIAERAVAKLDRLGHGPSLAAGALDPVAMTGEEEQEGVVRAGLGRDPAKGGLDRGAGRLGVGEDDAGRVQHAGLAEPAGEVHGIVVRILQHFEPVAIIGDPDEQGEDAASARRRRLARRPRAGPDLEPVAAGLAGPVGGDEHPIFAVHRKRGLDPAVGRAAVAAIVIVLLGAAGRDQDDIGVEIAGAELDRDPLPAPAAEAVAVDELAAVEPAVAAAELAGLAEDDRCGRLGEGRLGLAALGLAGGIRGIDPAQSERSHGAAGEDGLAKIGHFSSPLGGAGAPHCPSC